MRLDEKGVTFEASDVAFYYAFFMCRHVDVQNGLKTNSTYLSSASIRTIESRGHVYLKRA